MMRGTLVLLWPLVAASPLTADPADEAFSSGAYLEARDLWQTAAESGDPEAWFNLGVLYDLGLGVERNSERAFDHYHRAAGMGHAEAQFNVAVMIDAGTVGTADPDAAAVWYGRAAANGVPRAAYNLGLLYLGGTGVARNTDLASYWLGEAGDAVPAARDALDRIEPAEPTVALATPVLQGAARVDLTAGGQGAELVWTAPPDSDGEAFLVQIAHMPADLANGTLSQPVETPASAVSIPLDSVARAHAWRVLRIASGGDSYAASPWTPLDPAASDPQLPRGAVRFEVGAEDAGARHLAEVLADTLADNRVLVRIEEIDDPVRETGVYYAFEADASLARDLAEVMPGLAAESPEMASTIPNPMPGQVTISLSGGLGTAGSQGPASQTSTPASAAAEE